MNLMLLLPTLVIAALWLAGERMNAPARVPVRVRRH
jgi:hypothetical protein